MTKDTKMEAVTGESTEGGTCCSRFQIRSEARYSERAKARFNSAFAEAVNQTNVDEVALRHHLSVLREQPHQAAELESNALVTSWREQLQHLRKLRLQLGSAEARLARLMSTRPEGVHASEVKQYQGLYQSLMRLRNEVDRLRRAVASAQDGLSSIEKIQVELPGRTTEAASLPPASLVSLPRVCVAHLHYLALAVETLHVQHARRLSCWPCFDRRTNINLLDPSAFELTLRSTFDSDNSRRSAEVTIAGGAQIERMAPP
mmetsp:Transcript_56544/g.93447  ORF Transcript_56544/g.93447 Transcript_56544/m.93447 type:complete len:260 (-) Transcript_56544:82-861(-)|eukprot:CAMPEP_0119319096 /NCGR_PEP_ID=MMETSP1333-20130426/48463_1 /TAXON_ID=418940 /ORGANISM="Scyphosphaera apsteinii, Strain RCC1455" /LENGTH=259 /DNA_ID=CAMNT_0007325433 /DNA_START=215 /DNA_END=994 /DNA_ORIENTATION=+